MIKFKQEALGAEQIQRSNWTTRVYWRGSLALNFACTVIGLWDKDLNWRVITEGYAFREELFHCWFSVLAAF